ncbi:MAG: hypothetical protein UR28_C0027G0011 [Candidatus Peregrinibacteria bacterium GW2011_GWF2_33_10]|nr:MAG: hypothetical protein UR28_C0027G0011 [Candidatus Peregrinibacteria bacterium GW2011_GWF2_33_10]OGJ44850.1 MAG: hypothetical protein A2263_06470 [Candidatus Peregrinibacteria bacterium RIFOXYA2_FULL_33_21]OGJ47135.1 MAG: hypothetical protein A2272_03190 [Candidatus Peregrinibacteria bacterium RIFOXYA12_FULL_33_12]OGJ50536.1 MAG: hypothetical protein A2307_03095 [Candidatus Peregrinibacteria bacterium RIFOXYB2_FULL_33_20]
MDLQTLSTWITTHGYVLLFMAMCIEGPIVTSIGAFAAAHGYFNITIVFILSIFGDILPDLAYYYLGYFGHLKIVNRINQKLHKPRQKIEEIKNLIHKNTTKTIITIKITPILPLIGLPLLGAIHTSLRKFIITITVITFLRSAILVFAGYYFGIYQKLIDQYLGHFGSIIGGLALISLIIFLYKELLKNISQEKY